jgi:hypothetical protein
MSSYLVFNCLPVLFQIKRSKYLQSVQRKEFNQLINKGRKTHRKFLSIAWISAVLFITCKKLSNRESTVYKPCNQRISQARNTGRHLSSFCYLGGKTAFIALCAIVASPGLDRAKHGSLKIIKVLIKTSGIMEQSNSV